MQTGPAATAISNTHAAARMLLPLQLFRKELVKLLVKLHTMTIFLDSIKKKRTPGPKALWRRKERYLHA